VKYQEKSGLYKHLVIAEQLTIVFALSASVRLCVKINVQGNKKSRAVRGFGV